MGLSDILLQSFLAFISSLGFSLLLNIERKKATVAAFGGSIAWLLYLFYYKSTSSYTIALFMGSFAMGLYSEILARIIKSPATIFYIPGFIPLVPGSDMYYAVLKIVQGDIDGGIDLFIITLVKAGAITFGLIFASAAVMLYWNLRQRNLKKMFRRITRSEKNQDGTGNKRRKILGRKN